MQPGLEPGDLLPATHGLLHLLVDRPDDGRATLRPGRHVPVGERQRGRLDVRHQPIDIALMIARPLDDVGPICTRFRHVHFSITIAT